jgi:hypothetical protein
MEDKGQVGRTIFHQIGGNRLIAMTGARGFVCREKGLFFTIPNRKVNAVQITLNPRDEYDVQYLLVRGMTVKVVKEEKGIQCDQLTESFERNTGLRTSI